MYENRACFDVNRDSLIVCLCKEAHPIPAGICGCASFDNGRNYFGSIPIRFVIEPLFFYIYTYYEQRKKTKIGRLHFLQYTEEELREYLRLDDKLSKEEQRICARIRRMIVHALPRKKKKKKEEEDDW